MLFKSKLGLKLSKHLSILFSLIPPVSAPTIPSIHNCPASFHFLGIIMVLVVLVSWPQISPPSSNDCGEKMHPRSHRDLNLLLAQLCLGTHQPQLSNVSN